MGTIISYKKRAGCLVLILCALIQPSYAINIMSQTQVQDLAIEAYLYFYPLLTMDLTRKQCTNIEPDKEFGKGPMNMFVSAPTYPPANFKGVVRPNFDTLYSIAWLDLTKEPLIVSVPDTQGRYYLLPMLDMWSDVFASVGWRTTGTQAKRFLVTPPGWQGVIPAQFTQIKAPTSYVWIIGRTKTDGPTDYDAVHQIQAGYLITPLSKWGQAPQTIQAIKLKIDPTVDMHTSPKVQVDTMAADKYFSYAAELLKVQAPHLTDAPIIAQMKNMGIEAGKSFHFNKLDPVIQNALLQAPSEAQKLMKWKLASLARVSNAWSMNTDTMGVYGNYYLKRAMVAQLGLGANVPEDAIYPLNLGDNTGEPLSGDNSYVLHFNKTDIPPANAFWSITLYDNDGFQITNQLNRFAISSWMPLKVNADGSIDIYFQNANPGQDKQTNWLPAPKSLFNLTMRLYAPQSDALTGKWNPPAVMKVNSIVKE